MIPAEHAHLVIATGTHAGMRGKPNEDRYLITSHRLASQDRTPSVLALLADGIGGHRGGEVAAELAVKTISQHVGESSGSQPAETLQQAFQHANQVILERARAEPSLTGMGTTCVCAWVIADRLYATSVGDSRLYLHRGAELIRLSTDHTWVQEALAQGTLAPDQVKGHPNAHIIRRFLGSLNTVIPDMRLKLNPDETDAQAEANQGMRLMPGDRILLCTDGLTDLVRDTEILDLLRQHPLDSSLAHLINLANQRGGHDNITLVILEVPPSFAPAPPLRPSVKQVAIPAPRPPRSAASRWMLALLVIAILMMLALLFYTGLRLS
jgi:PPM family protein phosphatase